MTSQLSAVCVDALQPPRLARFWSGVLGRRTVEDAHGGLTIPPADGTGFRLRFPRVQEPKTGRNRMHFDLTSTSLEDQRQTVDRALELGARPIDVGQRPEEGHVVLADPEGNEFCVCEPDNAFLAGCGFIGALACDGSQEVGYFWSAALGWPLVWDQDEETAVQAPHGGPKVTWGGPPLMPRAGKDRLHFDLAPPAGSDQRAEAERLLSLGAKRADAAGDGTGRLAMTDPDGNPFSLLPTG
ncbi:VOC family protein [Streptomyces sp. NPDC048172]|uniref:VOC family protein n=1 Tax=Streptomyces sp. NPDC048172 TaxID=3365505 RepID=UPI003710BAA4